MPKPGTASIRDVRSLQAAMAQQARDIDAAGTEDVVIDPSRRLMIRSPNGTFWALVVSDTGALSTVNMGTSL